MAVGFDEFAARMTAPLSGLAQLLTGDREAAATLVYTALTRAFSARVPDERDAVTTLVRAWLAGAPPVGEPAEELPHDAELLRRSLDALPEKHRVAVALHHWSGFSVPEIAAVLRRREQAVAADLAAGVAELHVATPADPDEPPSTVDARLAELVAATGPPLVDVSEVAETGRRQQRQRRRTAVVAGVVLLAVATVATLLMGGEEKRALAATHSLDFSNLPPLPVVDDRARRLTAQLKAAMDDVLPGVTDLQPGGSRRPPLEFATSAEWDGTTIYFAEATVGSTLLILYVNSVEESHPPCSAQEPEMVCTPREFPDGTVAEVAVNAEQDLTVLSLLSQRPDGTVIGLIADNVGGPGLPELTAEDLFRFATVFTY